MSIRFSLIIILAIFGLLPLGAVAEPLGYAGSYGGTLVWQGTVVMTGDVLIRQGGELIIKPGTEVRVVPAEATKIDPEYLSSQTELLIRGRLNIEGTAAQPVRFVIQDQSGPADELIAWAGITLDSAADSSLLFAEIERADIGIRCVSSSPRIVGNRLLRCRYGIVAQQQSHPKILENHLEEGEGGIFCWRGSKPYLKGNTILNHDEEAVFADASSRPWLDRNTIRGNAIGLAITARDLPYDLTDVTQNTEDLRWLGEQGGGRP